MVNKYVSTLNSQLNTPEQENWTFAGQQLSGCLLCSKWSQLSIESTLVSELRFELGCSEYRAAFFYFNTVVFGELYCTYVISVWII
jgi:hypothetical protein